MKKRFLLILVILLGCMLGTALAAEGFTIPEIQNAEGHHEIFRSIVVHDSVHLLSTGKRLYALDTETQQATLVPVHNANPEYEQIPETALRFHRIAKGEAVPDWLKKEASLIDMLFWDGNAVYGVNELNGALYRMDFAKDGAMLHALAKLDFFSEVEGECMPSLSSGVACNGSLYLMMCLAADETQPSVYRFDMRTGAREPLKGQGAIVEIARYRDDHLLLLEKLSDTQWQITDFDPATSSRSLLFESGRVNIASESILGLLYDPWRNRVLIQADKELLTFVSETSCEVVAYLPPIWSYCRAIGEDGLLLLLHDESVYALSTLQKEPLSKPLQIACNDLEAWMDNGFAQAYPNIAVKHRQVNEYEAASLLAEQIAIQSDEIDIFEVPIGSAAQKAIEKGYYYPLNQSETIREKMNAYRPFFQQVAMKGIDIAAIPRRAEQYTLAYSKYALAQLGLTAADMPSSFMELMDFLLAWDERVGGVAQQEEITPFGDGLTNTQVKAVLFRMLKDQYYVLMEKDASAIPIYEADMAGLLDKLSLVCATIPQAPDEAPYVVTNERFQHIQVNDQPSYLFNVYSSFHPGRRNFSNAESVSDFVPIALTLPSQDRPLLLFEGTLFIVNPYSSQKERAIQWLSFYMNHLPAKDAAVFHRDAVPVESELYQKMKEYFTAEIERLKSRSEAAEGAAKKDLEAQLQNRQEKLRKIEAIKWDVSAQALEDYEQVFDQCAVFWHDPDVYAESFSKISAAYIFEGMPGNQVAHEFFATHKIILKESR
ncbi:MAG: hypothetical protein Q4C35_04545 [Eubacteriales bacterium]|nr:hypothetical protein [Eubacteriales bacterium]